jgi:hypothetical protein
MKINVLALFITALVAGPVAVNATPLTYDFTVTGGAVTSSGSFTFDSSIIPAGGGYINHTKLFSTLSFTWQGNSYNQTTANTAQLGFNSSGALVGALFGTNCGAGGCGIHVRTSEWWVSWFPRTNDFAYALTTVGGTYEGTASITEAQPSVPEPGTLGLFGLELGALILIRRRSAAST